ncbi:MAG: efflux RND transporter periplasmic adaptor subunit [Clostridiales bacterium]|nr:efflux RND transporter periplasmic adaptor subunit [Clostridiales bacterium]
MIKMIEKTKIVMFLIIVSLGLSACSLAPKEELLPDAPIIQTAAIKPYQSVEVIQGDIIERVKFDCTYKAFDTEQLSFAINGKRIEHIYVSEGDYIEAGDILADLEMNDIYDQIETRRKNIELLELRLSNEKELKELTMNNYMMIRNTDGYQEQLGTKYELEIINYEKSINKIIDDLKIEQMRFDSLNQDVKDRQIVAGIKGIVSYVASFNRYDTSNRDKNVISIYDPDTMVFVVTNPNPDLFNVGDKVNILVSGTEYEGIVIRPDKHDDTDESAKKTNEVYIEVEDEANLLQSGDRGEITFTLTEIYDVLYLPSVAVHEEDGKAFVYIEDEGGFKSIKEVEIGLQADNKVEIISGLQKGDKVIIN